MNIAVLGCGSIGKRHISNFLKLGLDVVAFNRGNKKANEVKKIFKIKTYTMLKSFLKKTRLTFQ